MHKIRQHIIFKLVTLILAIALLVPSLVKLSHAFNHHQHEICKGEYKAHLHKLDIDCKFYKFKLSTPFSVPNYTTTIVIAEDNYKIITSEYTMLSEYQHLHFSLRGPPQFI